MKKTLYDVRKHCYRLIDSLALRKDFSVEDTIIVSGSPRSGTTWVMNILNTLPDYLAVFEPFNVDEFPEAKHAGIYPRLFLPIDEENRLVYDYLEKVVRGRVRSKNPHIEMYPYDILKRFSADKLLIKFINANRLLPWISNLFTLRRIFLVVRHPCATIYSQIRSGWNGFTNENIIPRKQRLLDEVRMTGVIPDATLSRLSLETDIEKLSLVYALDNMIPLDAPEKYDVIQYERMVSNSEEIISIFESLNSTEYASLALRRSKIPSWTTKNRKETYFTYDEQLTKWEKGFTEKEINKIRSVLNNFDVDFCKDHYSILDQEFPLTDSI